MSKDIIINPKTPIILKDFSGLEALCGNIYFPENTDQIVKILKIANKNKLKVIPIGGKTGTSGGYSGKIDIGIDLRKISYIRKSPENTFVVGAGTKSVYLINI